MKKNVIAQPVVEGTVTGNQEGDITMNQPVYTFRKLNSTDIFLMFRIIGKIGINEFTACFDRDAVKQMITTITGDNAANSNTLVGISVMLEIANVVVGNLPKCETEIYQMLSNTSNLSVDEVKELDFTTFAEMVIDFIRKEEFKDFISVVSRLFKSEN